jgi:hypothetical protein
MVSSETRWLTGKNMDIIALFEVAAYVPIVGHKNEIIIIPL